jgi:hypothetical protein
MSVVIELAIVALIVAVVCCIGKTLIKTPTTGFVVVGSYDGNVVKTLKGSRLLMENGDHWGRAPFGLKAPTAAKTSINWKNVAVASAIVIAGICAYFFGGEAEQSVMAGQEVYTASALGSVLSVVGNIKEWLFKHERKLHFVPVRMTEDLEEVQKAEESGLPIFGFKTKTFVYDSKSDDVLVLGYEVKEKTNSMSRVEKTFRRIAVGLTDVASVKSEGAQLCAKEEIPYVEVDVIYNPLLKQIEVKTTEQVVKAKGKKAEDFMNDLCEDAGMVISSESEDMDEYVSFRKDNKTIYTNVSREDADKYLTFYGDVGSDDYSKQLKRMGVFDFDSRYCFTLKTEVVKGVGRDGQLGIMHPLTWIKFLIFSCKRNGVSKSLLAAFMKMKDLNNFVIVSRIILGGRFGKGTIALSINAPIDTVVLFGYSSFVKELEVDFNKDSKDALVYFKVGIETAEAPFGETVIPNLVGGVRLFRNIVMMKIAEVRKHLVKNKFNMAILEQSTDDLSELVEVYKAMPKKEGKIAKVIRLLGFLWMTRQIKTKTEKVFKNLKVKVTGSRHCKIQVAAVGHTYLFDDTKDNEENAAKHAAVVRHLTKASTKKEKKFGTSTPNCVIHNKSFFVAEKSANEFCFTIGGADLDGDSVETIFTGISHTITVKGESFNVYDAIVYRFPVGHGELRRVKVMVMDKEKSIVLYPNLELAVKPVMGEVDVLEVVDVMPPLKKVELDINDVLDFEPPADLIGWFTNTLLALQFSLIIARVLGNKVMVAEIEALRIWNIQTSEVVDCGRGGSTVTEEDIMDAIEEANNVEIYTSSWTEKRTYGWDEDLVTVVEDDNLSIELGRAMAFWKRVEAEMFTEGMKRTRVIRSLFNIDSVDLTSYPFAKYLVGMWGSLWNTLLGMTEDEEAGFNTRTSNAVHAVVKTEFAKVHEFSEGIAKGAAMGLLLNFLSKYGAPVIKDGKKLRDENGVVVRGKGMASIVYSNEVLPLIVNVLKTIVETGVKPEPHGGLIASNEVDETVRGSGTAKAKYSEIKRLSKKLSTNDKYLVLGYKFNNKFDDEEHVLNEEGFDKAFNCGRRGIFAVRASLSNHFSKKFGGRG